MNFKVNLKPHVAPDELATFTAGADVPRGANPWDGKDDKRRIPRFQMRLTDYEMAKLKHKAGEGSMHEFCLKVIQSALT